MCLLPVPSRSCSRLRVLNWSKKQPTIGIVVAVMLCLICPVSACSRGAGQCGAAVAAATHAAASVPEPVRATAQPISILVGVSDDAIRQGLEAAAGLLAEELRATLGRLPGGIEPEVEFDVSELSLRDAAGEPSLRFRLRVSAGLEVRSPVGASMRAGSEGGALITAGIDLRSDQGGSGIYIDPAHTHVGEVTASATGLGALARPVSERLERGLREVLNTRVGSVLGDRALVRLEPIRVDRVEIDIAIREVRVVEERQQLLIGASVGLEGTEALTLEPFGSADAALTMRVGIPTALALARRGLSVSGATEGAGSSNSAPSVVLSIDRIEAGADGSLEAELSGFRSTAPCGSASVRGRFQVGAAGGVALTRVLDWELTSSSRPEWLTRRAMPDSEEIRARVERSLAEAIAPRTVSLAIGEVALDIRSLSMSPAGVELSADVRIAR